MSSDFYKYLMCSAATYFVLSVYLRYLCKQQFIRDVTNGCPPQVCRRSGGGVGGVGGVGSVGGAGEYVSGVVPAAAPAHHLALTINQQRLRAAPYDNLVRGLLYSSLQSIFLTIRT